MKSLSSLTTSIVRVCHQLSAQGFVPALDGNVSARRDARTILVTTRGKNKGEVTAKDVVAVRLDGRLVHKGPLATSELPMHLAIYRERPVVGGVVHAHPPYATALAASGQRLTINVLPEVILALGIVPLIPYAMPSTDDLGKLLIPHVGASGAALLANHGAVTWAKTVREAYLLMEKLEHAAQVEFLARLLGGPKALSDPQVSSLLAQHPYTARSVR